MNGEMASIADELCIYISNPIQQMHQSQKNQKKNPSSMIRMPWLLSLKIELLL